MKQTPYILETRGNPLDDAPGIRTVVFFKGCSPGCTWCHNPESKNKQQEISFDKSVCKTCDICLESCQQKALNREYEFFIDRDKCDLCFEFTERFLKDL